MTTYNHNNDDTPSSPLRRSSHQQDESVAAAATVLPVAYKVDNNNGEQTDSNVVVAVLEDAIQTCEEEFVIKEVTPDELVPPEVTCCDIICAQFKWPLLALLVVTGSAIGVIYTQLVVLYQYFPYYACVINFLGGVPSTKTSMDNMAFAVIPRLEQMERRIQQTAEANRLKANAGYESYAAYVKQQSNEAINYVRERLPPKLGGGAGGIGSSAALASTGNTLESYSISQSQINQDLDTDALIGNDNAKNKKNVTTTTTKATTTAKDNTTKNNSSDDFDPESANSNTNNNNNRNENDDDDNDDDDNILRGSRYVCLPFQSYELFVFLVEVPILTVLLCIQLLGVWYFQAVFNGSTTYQDYETGEFLLIESKRLAPLKYSISTFAIVVIQILLAKLFANASRVARIINVRLQNRAKDMKEFKQHLASCMIFLKKKLVKFLEFITNTKKIKDFTTSAITGLQSSFTKAIGWTGMTNPNSKTSN